MMDDLDPKHSEREHWLDRPSNQALLFRALVVVCALLLLADFAYHKHAELAYEGWWGFFAFFGFLAYLAIVMGAKGLRKLVMRPEDYYQAGEERRGR